MRLDNSDGGMNECGAGSVVSDGSEKDMHMGLLFLVGEDRGYYRRLFGI